MQMEHVMDVDEPLMEHILKQTEQYAAHARQDCHTTHSTENRNLILVARFLLCEVRG